VARLHAPSRPMGPVGVQEHEFQADPAVIARARIGRDGEPELLLHDDLGGYSWNVPKTGWLNVGSGTANPNQVRAAWQRARQHFQDSGHIPIEAAADLEPKAMKGHAYYLFDPVHLEAAARVDAGGRGGSYLVGDSLGLAQPLTAEGILPAVVSGRVLAEAILAGDPASYPDRLRGHPVIQDYRRIHAVREAVASLGRTFGPALGGAKSEPMDGVAGETPTPARPGLRLRLRAPAPVSRLGRRALATGFAWMFSGAKVPAPRLVDLALSVANKCKWMVGGGDKPKDKEEQRRAS
jgi:hypothetical protein